MATDRVGIYIDLMGYDEAMAQMEALDKELRGFGKWKAKARVEAEVEKLEFNKRALKANKVKLQADMSDIEKQLKRAKRLLASLEGQRPLYKKGSPAMHRLETEIKRIKSEIADLNGQKIRVQTELGQTQREINETISMLERLKAALRGFKGMTIPQVFKKISANASHLGGALQSAGNALTRLNQPMRMLTSGALLGAGFGAMQKVTEGLESGFARHDIMRKYPRIMERMGFSSEVAQKNIEKLDSAVQGLPTGLDEIVDVAQRYTLTLGDINKGTDLAIAANNAFLASMATDTQKYQGMMQLQDLLNGKKLRNTEWNSLIDSMSAGINEIGKELGYSGDEMDKFRQDLLANKITPDEFLGALMKVGTGKGSLAQLASESMDTWEAFSSRINSAFSRMTNGILNTSDEMVNTLTHGKFKSLNSFLDDKVIKGIDKLSESAQNWIKEHPDEIVDFFKSLKGIDWKGLATGFADGIKTMADGIKWAADKLGGKNLERLGKAMAFLGPVGNALTIGGGLFRGGRHPLGAIGALAVFLGRKGLGGIGKLLGKGGGKLFGNMGWFKKLSGLFKGLGKAGDAAEDAAKGASKFKKFAKVAGKFGKGGAGLSVAKDVAIGIGVIGGIITEITGIAWINSKIVGSAVKSFKGIVTNIRDSFKVINEIGSMDVDVKGGAAAIGKVGDIFNAVVGAFTEQKGETKNKAVGKNIVTQNAPDPVKAWKKIKPVADGIKGLKGIMDNVKGIYDTLAGEDGLQNVDVATFDTMVNRAKSLIGNLGRAWEELQPDLQKLSGAGEMATDVTGVLTSINNFKLILDQLSQIGTLMDQGAYGDAKGQTGGQLGQLGGGMSDPFAKINGVIGSLKSMAQKLAGLGTEIQAANPGALMANAESIKQAIGKLKSTVTSLQGLGEGGLATTDTGAFVAISNLKSMISQLGSALNTDGIAQLQADVEAFKATVDSIFESLNTAFSDVKVEVHINGKVTGDKELVAEVKAAQRRIANAVASIRTSYSKTVRISIHRSVSVTGSVPTNVGAPTQLGGGDVNSGGIHAHTGGYITPTGKVLYRNKGGSVGTIFKPKGIDTIPAMLAPGEYVQNPKAVKHFGIEFMQRINNLDLSGAIRALSTRAGFNSAMARGTTIYNNVTNNNNVNQNITTNNPNFAFKRSNRFVGAL